MSLVSAFVRCASEWFLRLEKESYAKEYFLLPEMPGNTNLKSVVSCGNATIPGVGPGSCCKCFLQIISVLVLCLVLKLLEVTDQNLGLKGSLKESFKISSSLRGSV